MDELEQLGFYTLAGASRSPCDLITEVRDAKALSATTFHAACQQLALPPMRGAQVSG